MSIGIVKNLPSENSVSMDRYAEELKASINLRTDVRAEIVGLDIPNASLVTTRSQKLVRYYNRYLALPRSLREFRPDIFHVADHSYAFLLPRLGNTPKVVTCHDLMLLTRAEWQEQIKWTPAVSLFRYSVSKMKYATRVIAVSERTRADILKFGLADENRITVVPPSLNPHFEGGNTSIRLAVRAKWNLSPDDFVILHVGTPGRYKNVSTVIKCVAELRRRGQPATLLRAGRTVDGDTTHLIREEGIDRYTLETGPIPDADLAELYQSADVLLFPSHKEGFGWPVIEAMASGLPVVASRAEAISESLAGAGYQADATDVLALVDGMERIISDNVFRTQLISLGLDRSKRFQRANTGAMIQLVYDSIMSEP